MRANPSPGGAPLLGGRALGCVLPLAPPLDLQQQPQQRLPLGLRQALEALREHLSSVADLAAGYLRLLHDRHLSDVLVVGSSLGGWIGAELAAADTEGLISGLILLNAVGIEVAGEPVQDFFALDARGVAEHAFHDSERFYVDPATVPAGRLAAVQADMAALRVFSGGPAMSDPALRPRLAAVDVPTLVLWGESDRIATPAYGEEYAASFGNARFAVVAEAGHLPHLEQPARTFALIDAFAAQTARR
ncbi:alpha/beta fold hydrolase [Streptomyces sp. AK04-3B]|uniref:alpha/beta fold hydrolase n=1 Tax=Streptomyces sp. AK04-3B TaxID=3028650 RepID=UPI0029A0FDD2|nr:alpha/beta fold hydrolase [Streptomyces sp. AK04-3B]MDX3804082.1 alpha/beta fold hydrolase [Streptomyces sp. AK04-3B]